MPPITKVFFTLVLGVTLDMLGYHEQAIESYEHAIKLNPKNEDAYNSYGNTLKTLGDFT